MGRRKEVSTGHGVVHSGRPTHPTHDSHTYVSTHRVIECHSPRLSQPLVTFLALVTFPALLPSQSAMEATEDAFDELDEDVDSTPTCATSTPPLHPSTPPGQLTSPAQTQPSPTAPPSPPLHPTPPLASPPRTSTSASLHPPAIHSPASLSPRASELPLSSSFLQSLATLPPLAPSLSPSLTSSSLSASSPSPSSSPLPSPFIPCPCQSEPPLPHLLLSPRKSSPSSSSPSSSPSPKSVIPLSVSHILSSISAAQSTPTPPPTSLAPPFSPSSIRRIVDYLESLSHHLAHTHTTLIRYLQHSRHQQLLPPSDPLLALLERSNLALVNQLKQLRLDEDAARQRLRDASDVIEGGKRTAALSLSRLPSFMQTERRRLDEVERARGLREEEVRGLEGLGVRRGRVQQQLMAVSGVVGELRREGGGRVKYEVALDGMRDAAMREVIGEAEAGEAVQRLEVMRGWREQEEGAEHKLKQIERVEREMRERLDHLIVLYYK